MRKAFNFIALILLLCTVFSLTVSAAAIDGLEINFVSDKTDYRDHDSITTKLTVTNQNETDVTNISLENQIPEGYKLSDDSDSVLNIEKLAPGESFSSSAKMISNIPKPNYALMILLFSIGCVVLIGAAITVLFVVKKKSKKKAKEIISVVLCLALLSSFSIPALAQQNQSKLTLTHSVKVAGDELILKSLLTYDRIIGEKENFAVDTQNMLYDPLTDTYHVTDKMTKLTGTLLYTDNVSSAVCNVFDVNDNLLFSKEFKPENMWSIDGFALIVGLNKVNISVAYDNGMIYETSFNLNNICEENMESLDVDKNDDDQDGVLNFTETMYHTDPKNADSDGDGLSDYYEMAILGTDAMKSDTDGDGTADGDKDTDNDGLTNLKEINDHGTNPISIDSDGDNLSDNDEITTHSTDPNNADTDNDGKKDGWEIENSSDPLTANTDFPKDTVSSVPDNVTVESDGEVTVTELVDDHMINENSPGYIGSAPVHIELESGHTANITMEYNAENLAEGETPTLYFFDETTQCYETVSSEVDENGKVKASINKSGVYVLLNHRFIDDVWQNDIFKPSETTEDGNIDVVFVIDRSNSMYQNDPNNLRKEVTKEFINKLRDDSDRAAIVQFNSIGETVMTLTSDKEALCNSVDAIETSDGGGCAGSDANAGTNGSAGIRTALTELEGSTAKYKYIIFLTDGKDTSVSEDYGDEAGTTGLTGEAKTKGIVIHTVGLVGTGEVDTDLLKRVATGTGGNYYLATVGEDAETNSELVEIYREIESVTIDRHLDTNQDGISDYYTKLICDGKLMTGTGIRYLFGSATYDEVQSNADLDGDGLLNGQELAIIENDKGVFVKINSYPTAANSDGDRLNDYEEISTYATSPFKINGSVSEENVTWATTSENFVSEKYRSLYDSDILGSLERGSVWIGNVFFGTVYDQSLLHESALAKYFELINTELKAHYDLEVSREIAQSMTTKILDNTEYVVNNIDSLTDVSLEDAYNLLGDVLNSIGGTSVETFYEVYYKPIEGQFTQEHLNKLIEQVRHYEGEWLKADPKKFASSDDYWTYINDVIGKYSEASKDKISFEGEFKFFKNFKKLKGALKAVDIVFDVVEVATTGYDAYKEFTSICSNLEIMMDNMYILDVIIEQSDDSTLTLAANSLKYRINDMYNDDINDFSDFLTSYEFIMPITSTVVGEAIHGKIATLGVPGMVVELVRVFGNLVFNMADVAQECSKLYAVAKSADLLGSTYINYLNAGYGTLANSKWAFFAEDNGMQMTHFLNLVVARKYSEEQMVSADKANSFLVEWLFTKFMYKTSECESNIDKAERIIKEYT